MSEPNSIGSPTGIIGNFALSVKSYAGDHTLNSSDNGSALFFSALATVLVPAGLGAGFNCLIIQEGTNQVSVMADTGIAVNNSSGNTKTSGQYAEASLVTKDGTNFVFAGDTGA